MTHLFVSPLYRPGLNGPKSTAHEYLSFPLLLSPSNVRVEVQVGPLDRNLPCRLRYRTAN